MKLNDAVILSAARTPVGRANRGALRNVRPETLGAVAVQGAIERVSGLSHELIEDVLMGCAFPEGPQGMNIARTIALKAGLPESVTGATVNRFCSSGLQTIAQAVAGIQAGQFECIVAGGVESMSLVPMGGFYFSPDTDYLQEKPGMYTTMGITAENVADQYDISREDQDRFALRSHQKAYDAIEGGRFDEETVPVPVEEVVYNPRSGQTETITYAHNRDEGARPDTSMEALAKLRPAFKQGGSVTAGNSSQMNDAGAAVVVTSSDFADKISAEPIARLLSFAVTGVAPEIMGIGPITAVRKALEKADMKIGDIELFELNEAFASQSLAVIRELGLPEELVNVNGGAIALGHPLGCTGAKLTTTLLYEMKRRGLRYGVVTMCIGGGMGAAGVFENLQL